MSCLTSGPIATSGRDPSSPGTARAARRAPQTTRFRSSPDPCEALIVEVGRKNEARDEFSELLVENLAHHKIPARYQHFVVDEISVADTLLSAISDHAADLLVIGAFDSAPRSLFGRSSSTPNILAHMTAPVLFSH